MWCGAFFINTLLNYNLNIMRILIFLLMAIPIFSQDCLFTTINLDAYPAGTVLSDQFDFVNISAVNNNGPNIAMLFDTDNPTGGDTDLDLGIGMGIIISEDGDSSDPDDDKDGGIVTLAFTGPALLDEIPFGDIENNKTFVKLYDWDGTLLHTTQVPKTGDGGLVYVNLPNIVHYKAKIELGGSGLIGKFKYCVDETLPVVLSSFTVSTVRGVNILNWITESEFNFAFFTVEHSIDGYNWEDVNNVRGGRVAYSFEHLPPQGRNFYRLKAVDLDGSYLHSDIVTIVNRDNIFENPFLLENAQVYDLSGRLIMKDDEMPTGIYFIVYRNNVYKLLK
jgi:hypothetical protein